MVTTMGDRTRRSVDDPRSHLKPVRGNDDSRAGRVVFVHSKLIVHLESGKHHTTLPALCHSLRFCQTTHLQLPHISSFEDLGTFVAACQQCQTSKRRDSRWVVLVLTPFPVRCGCMLIWDTDKRGPRRESSPLSIISHSKTNRKAGS